MRAWRSFGTDLRLAFMAPDSIISSWTQRESRRRSQPAAIRGSLSCPVHIEWAPSLDDHDRRDGAHSGSTVQRARTVTRTIDLVYFNAGGGHRAAATAL